MNKSDQESDESGTTPKMEVSGEHSKPTPRNIKNSEQKSNDVISEDGIQIEAQTVNSKYKFGSDVSDQKASKSEIDDKQDIKAEDGSRAMTIQEDERKTSLMRADQEAADQLIQGPVVT